MLTKLTLFFVGAVHQLEITTSYTTPYQCSNGSYALISGTNLTLEYDYKHHYSKVRMTWSLTFTVIISYPIVSNHHKKEVNNNNKL